MFGEIKCVTAAKTLDIEYFQTKTGAWMNKRRKSTKSERKAKTIRQKIDVDVVR